MTMGPSGWHSMRSYTRDSSVTRQKLPPGTLRRIVSFAKPYKRPISWLLGLLVIDAGIGAAVPLLYREIINKGILGRDSALVLIIAGIVGVIAVVDAGLSVVERYFSARIGEGLIYDMRAKVFAHVQRMPIAFFTRTQTGALISRLNNDVLGAQQAFTSTLSSVVTNVFTLSITLAVMFALSWQITLVALLLLPLFVFPARWVGRKLQVITRESYNLNAAMNTTMTERFNVSGALLVKLFGRPEQEDRAFQDKAARVRDIGVTSAMYSAVFFAALMMVASLATALVYGWGGWLAVHGALDVGTVVALTAYLTRLYGPLTSLSNVNVDIMTALVSFDRVFEVLDLPPMIADAPEAKRASGRAPTPSSSTTCLPLPGRRRGLARLARVGRGARLGAEHDGAARHLVPRRAGPARRARRPVGRRQDDDHRHWSPGCTTCRAARSASAATTCARSPVSRCATRSGW